MDCKSAADRITRVVSGNGSPEDAADVHNHVVGCPACAALERGLSRTWALMGQLKPVDSRVEVPAAPRRTVLRSPLWVIGAAAAAVLVVSALAFSLFKPQPGRTTPSPVAVQTPAEDPTPETQREEENRVQEVLTKIEHEKPTAPAPVIVDPAPVTPEPKPVVQTPKPEPKPVEPPQPEPKEVVKEPVVETRPEPKPPVAPPAPAVESAVVAVATLDRVEGDVFAVSSGKRSAVRSGARLIAGDAIETSGKASQAVVEFADGTRLVLGADTIVDSIRTAEGKHVSLKQGVLAAQVSKQPAGEPMVFLTATAEARVLGTRLTLSVTPASTRLEVREGKVRVTRKDDGASVDVTADHYVQAGKGLSLTPKPATTVRVALQETFDRARWGGTWIQGGEANLGIRLASENGSLSLKTLQKPSQDLGGAKMPSDAAELARKAVQSATNVAGLSKKEWPRAAWLETRQAFGFSNEAPLKIRVRAWNSHHDADRIAWFAINRGIAGQGLSLERRGASLQLSVEGATAPLWRKDIDGAQEWETLELWISKDQVVVRRNEETLFAGANPLKVKAGTLSLGVHAKLELVQDEELRVDEVDVFLTTKAEMDEVAR